MAQIIIGIALIAFAIIYILFYIFIKKYDFVNIKEIYKDYKKIFHQSKSDLYAFTLIPLFGAIGVTLTFNINSQIVELICTTVSILLGLLFATLGVLASIPSPRATNNDERQQAKKQTYKCVYQQSVQLILYLGVLSITELILLFAAIIISSSSFQIPVFLYNWLRLLGSIAIYDLAFSILLNCLIVFKRISLIIKERHE